MVKKVGVRHARRAMPRPARHAPKPILQFYLRSARFRARRIQGRLHRMKKIVLLRHGESVWNRENRFTGWTDVDLSEQGLAEAREAGRLLKEAGFGFDLALSSVLKR